MPLDCAALGAKPSNFHKETESMKHFLDVSDYSPAEIQDILDLEAPFTVSVAEGFDYWVPEGAAEDAEPE